MLVSLVASFFLFKKRRPNPSPELGENKQEIENGEELVLAMTIENLDSPKKSGSRYRKNELFMGNLFIISIFYTVTVMQTAFDAEKRQYLTGDYNICYYNSRCQIPLGEKFLDFNHFFSNMGYILFGLTFIVAAFIRHIRDQDLHGIPYLHGVYYTMGLTLVMEGVMSAFYHICPTNISFQFDTTYMFLIAILITAKLYQNRHFDSSFNSVPAYFALGAAVAFQAISSYYQDSTVFWVLFCIVYMTSLVYILATMYYNEKVPKSRRKPTRHEQALAKCKEFFGDSCLLLCCQCKKPLKLKLAIMYATLIGNGCMCFHAAWDGSDSSFLLNLFMANMALYLLYYIAMKYLSGERLNLVPIVYLGKLN